MKDFMIVVEQSEPSRVNSSRSESGERMKCTIVLRDVSGKYSNEYICTMWDNMAQARFYPGDMVYVNLAFRRRSGQSTQFQYIEVVEIHKVA